ncbi:helix-turn-helix domain-containing protein [Sphingorhabdus soli]|uniref:Helix-turn-helix domain-containing protein n=1 Tax=Flavisphingopyxis soli TaxID=2601267 RepID=A0A5C6U7L3_9SPHN|nr:excisionase family DNA-binding protein [Sphingorhabdus soli]TXC67715.1 helix-turn-helix domain-containing protein [Sphingorhabdus soli]
MAALAVNMESLHEPSVEEIDAARLAARQFSKLDHGVPISFTPQARKDAKGEGGAKVEPITIPANIFRTMIKMLVEMGNGNAVAVVPVSAELTTQQAADLLNVSRPHLVKLLKERVLPFRMVGTHRKLLAKDVLNHREKFVRDRRDALAKMVELDEELGLIDDESVGSKD